MAKMYSDKYFDSINHLQDIDLGHKHERRTRMGTNE